MEARDASHAGNANCTGAFIERNVSAMTSSRAIASSTSAEGPRATIHEAFICGSAHTLLRPLRTNVSALL